MKDYIEDKLKGEPNRNMYFKKIKLIAEAFASVKDSKFKFNEYQVLNTARLICEEEPNSKTAMALKLPAGSGKTMIILMGAKHFMNEGHKVRIIVPTPQLKMQYAEDVHLYVASDNLEIICIDDLIYKKGDDDYVYFCDEADLMLEHHAVSFKTMHDFSSYPVLHGIAALYFSKKVYFCSATYSSYVEGLLRTLFAV